MHRYFKNYENKKKRLQLSTVFFLQSLTKKNETNLEKSTGKIRYLSLERMMMPFHIFPGISKQQKKQRNK